MNNINGINSYSKLGSVRPTPPAVAEVGSISAAQAAKRGQDEVEISAAAQFLSRIAAMPDIRQDKVEAIQQALADGSYDIDGKLPEALDRLLDEYA